MDEKKDVAMTEGTISSEAADGTKTDETCTAQEQDKGSKGKKEKKPFSWKREIIEWIESIGIAVIVALLLNHFVFSIVQVSGPSMENTLMDGDRLFVLSNYISKPERGDIVVFRPVNDPDRPYIKRVIAVAGQTVELDEATSRVYVDGELVDEPYVKSFDGAYIGNMEYPLTVEEGCIFVMGDNRPNSKDSRMSEVGQVEVDTVMGKVLFRWFPFDRMHGSFDAEY